MLRRALRVVKHGVGLLLVQDVAQVEIIDDYTLQVNVHEPSCAALIDIANIPVIPSHQYLEWFPTFEDVVNPNHERNLPFNTEVVSAGPFILAEYRPGDRVVMIANPNYAEPYLDHVVPQAYIIKLWPAGYNTANRWEAFKNDQISDPAKNTLYIFLSSTGNYIAANFTGK